MIKDKVDFFDSEVCNWLFLTICLRLVDILWSQLIKLAQVASTLELLKNQQNALLFFEIVPCHFCGASEVQT
jgi:hypothetical protein